MCESEQASLSLSDAPLTVPKKVDTTFFLVLGMFRSSKLYVLRLTGELVACPSGASLAADGTLIGVISDGSTAVAGAALVASAIMRAVLAAAAAVVIAAALSL